MDKKLAKNIFFSVICSLLLLGGVLGVVFGIIQRPDTTAFNSSYTESANAVVVSEIWNGSTFDKTNTQTLFNMLCNSSSGSISTLSSNIGSSTINATTLRGYSSGGNTSGKSIVVTLGGFKWIVTYLFKDSDGNTCATLWMANANGRGTYGDTASYYGTDNWSSGYQTSMYGLSYVSTVTLNNGGQYIKIISNSSNPTSISGSATSSSTHEYAAFTHSSGGIRPYIVQPNNVPYQTSSQGTNPTGNVLMNESLATNLTGYYSTYSYQGLVGYTNWGDDYLWLPSLSETGATSSYPGMWQTSQAERANSTTYSWSRSGYYGRSNYVYYLYSSGDNYRYNDVSADYAIRPALHLNLTAVAKEMTKVSITLDKQSGVGGSDSVYAYPGNAMSTIDTPVRAGYNFGGYYTSTNGGGTQYYNASGASVVSTYPSGGPTMLYAKWTSTLNLDLQGGTGGTTSITATYGAGMPSATAPTRSGYTFGGYYTGVGGGGTQYYSNTMASVKNCDLPSGTTLYAKWTSTINLDQNGGSGGTTSITAIYGVAMPTATAPTRSGYAFDGYYIVLNGVSIQYYTSTMASVHTCDLPSGTTLYAKWTPNTYTITFNYNGATEGNTTTLKTVTFDTGYEALPTPLKDGYVFGGWYLESNFTTKITSLSIMTTASDHTLYAKWNEWLKVTASGTGTSVTVEGFLYNKYNAYVYITPSAGQYVQKVSFDNVTFYEIVYASTKITNLDFAISANCEATMASNKFGIEISGAYSALGSEVINVYLVMTNTPYEALKQAGGTSVSGVAVSATTGGSVTIIGDDYDEMLDTDTITVKADICLSGYQFDGWYLASNMDSCISTEMSEKFAKSLVYESQLVAKFSAIGDNTSINGSTSN